MKIKKYQNPSDVLENNSNITTAKPVLDNIQYGEDGVMRWKDKNGNIKTLFPISDTEYVSLDTEGNITNKFNIDPEVVSKLKRYDAKDLDNFFANLLTFGAANELTEGAKHIDKGEYLDALKNYANIAVFGPGSIGNVTRALYGLSGLLDENGIRKTGELALGTRNDGLTGNRIVDTVASASGDILNYLLARYGGTKPLVEDLAKAGNNTARAYTFSRALNGDINATRLGQQNPYLAWGAPVTFGRTSEAMRANQQSSRISNVGGIEGKVPIITEENAHLMTPEQWTAAQDTAIARGDMQEAQRLSDLHADVNGYSIDVYHQTSNKFHTFKVGPQYTKHAKVDFATPYGIFTKGSEEQVALPGDVQMHLRGKMKNPLVFNNREELEQYLMDNIPKISKYIKVMRKARAEGNRDLYRAYAIDIKPEVDKYFRELGIDGIILKEDHAHFKNATIFDTNIFLNPEQVKSANAVTYIDGVRVPLGERHNSKVKDTRFFNRGNTSTPYPGVNPAEIGDPLEPLYARLSRFEERQRFVNNPKYKELAEEMYPEGFNNIEQKLLVGDDIQPNQVKEAMRTIDPNISEKDLRVASDIVMGHKSGVHFNYESAAGQETGFNAVSIIDAMNMVRRSNGRELLPRDVGIILGHEIGHIKIPQAALDAISGYYAPEEFFTQAGQILDNAGIKNTLMNPVSSNKFMQLTRKYLEEGNVDNGISKLYEFMKKLTPNQRNKIIPFINRLSAGLFGTYLVSQGLKQSNKNGKVQL